ncbi:hypothetical protein [Arthrobacter sp. B0490]|uniref:hypothetical protein n=1 Tax=Arthrobacter sp. B0490 TaxID=2058891 RepID=UPI000CE331FE|nr:hypothetical protein [Arthrobacter sp. B0490]
MIGRGAASLHLAATASCPIAVIRDDRPAGATSWWRSTDSPGATASSSVPWTSCLATPTVDAVLHHG